MLKQKGISRKVKAPDFWSRNESEISEEFKQMIYEQYLSQDTLHVYCDCSLNSELRQMAVACTYVNFRRIIVKQQYVYPPKDCIDKPIFGELKALIFALTHFEKYMRYGCEKVILYSDVDDIEKLVHQQITFKKNKSLDKTLSELILLLQKMKKKNPQIKMEIAYLHHDKKVYNPFHRSSHNAANKMMNKKIK